MWAVKSKRREGKLMGRREEQRNGIVKEERSDDSLCKIKDDGCRDF